MSESVTVQEEVVWEGRRMTVSWLPAPFLPPSDLTTQVSGICFTEHRKIVLVSGDGRRWDMPGGRPEQGESLEEALARHVWGQARARVVRGQYIGCERVEDSGHPDGPRIYYQAHCWARVEVYPFKAPSETAERQLIDTASFLSTLFWAESSVAPIILERGIAVENRNGGACF